MDTVCRHCYAPLQDPRVECEICLDIFHAQCFDGKSNSRRCAACTPLTDPPQHVPASRCIVQLLQKTLRWTEDACFEKLLIPLSQLSHTLHTYLVLLRWTRTLLRGFAGAARRQAHADIPPKQVRSSACMRTGTTLAFACALGHQLMLHCTPPPRSRHIPFTCTYNNVNSFWTKAFYGDDCKHGSNPFLNPLYTIQQLQRQQHQFFFFPRIWQHTLDMAGVRKLDTIKRCICHSLYLSEERIPRKDDRSIMTPYEFWGRFSSGFPTVQHGQYLDVLQEKLQEGDLVDISEYRGTGVWYYDGMHLHPTVGEYGNVLPAPAFKQVLRHGLQYFLDQGPKLVLIPTYMTIVVNGEEYVNIGNCALSLDSDEGEDDRVTIDGHLVFERTCFHEEYP